jgi:hypothetical protein
MDETTVYLGTPQHVIYGTANSFFTRKFYTRLAHGIKTSFNDINSYSPQLGSFEVLYYLATASGGLSQSLAAIGTDVNCCFARRKNERLYI